MLDDIDRRILRQLQAALNAEGYGAETTTFPPASHFVASRRCR